MAAHKKSGHRRQSAISKIGEGSERGQVAQTGSEKRFQALIENSMDAIAVLSADGTVVYESPSVNRVLGYKPQELMGRSVMELLHPDDLQEVASLFSDLTAHPGQVAELEVRFLHRDGTWRTMIGIGHNLIDDPDIEGIVVNYRDVTDRRKANEALRESEEKYRSILEGIEDGFYEVDITGNFTFFNDPMCEIIGYPKDEMMGMNNRQYMDKENAKKVFQAFNRAYTTEKHAREFGWEIIRKDGTKRFLEASVSLKRDSEGEPIGFRGIVRDISDRRKTEEALREGEEKFRSVLDNSFDMVYRMDLATGRYDYVSPSSKKLLGYEPSEFISLGSEYAASLIHPDDIDNLSNGVISLMALSNPDIGASTIEYRIKHRESGYRWVADNVSIIHDETNVPVAVVGNLRDVTAQRTVETALRESEERLKALLENAPEAIISYDFSGTILNANKKAEELVGHSSKAMIGKNMFELGVIPDDYAPRTTETLAKASAGVEERPFEFELIKKDGVRITVEATTISVERGGELEVLCIARDITERKRMEEALLLKENAIENAVSAVAMSDMEGKITYVNRACMRLWGSENKKELLDKPYWVLLKSDEAIQDIAAVMLAKGSWEGELVAKRKDGTEVQVQVWASMVKDVQGKPTQTISSFLDITEGKKAEEEKHRMEHQLQLAGRLAAVGELAAGVAHELNNPLAAVQAFAQFLADRKDLDEAVKTDVETIYRESQRASRITSNLLSFARKHKPDKSPLSINEVVEKSLELHDYRLKVNNIVVSRELDRDIPMTMADFHQMQQVFINIITNAEQAMTEAHGKGTLVVKTQISGEIIKITFTDNGPGIRKENLKSIFDPFFTTKDVGKGTGLGLSICFGIVQEHGGSLYATSGPGNGSTFVIELPVTYEIPLAAEETDSTHHPQSIPHTL